MSDQFKNALDDNQEFTSSGKWYLQCCTHQKAFEIYLPLIKIFRFEFLKYKQYVCPDCKQVDCKPWSGMIISHGDGI